MNAGQPIRLCVLGKSGRMGKQVIALATDQSGLHLSSTVDVGDDLGVALEKAQVYIDFTTPRATELAAQAAAAHRTAAVVGTTGLDAAAEAALTQLAKVAPVLVAANFSPGVALLLHLAETAARALGSDYDLEVVELHHRNKVDSPSGTALALGQALADGRKIEFDSACVMSRQGQVGPRKDDEIGIFAVRGGDIVGEHTAYLVGAEERLELTHRAQKRSVFASGALKAARWVAGQPPGRYSMADVLGFGPPAG